jgi:3-deoxy-D-manno-octulosonic-acid transferase
LVLSPWTHVKWTAFRALEAGAAALTRVRAGDHEAAAETGRRFPVSNGGRLWLFASTIGELNAVEPFLSRYLPAAGNPDLLLVCDHQHYREAFLARYPAATFLHLTADSADARRAVDAWPPVALLIAEIPCLLSDAPGRFPFAIVYHVKGRGAPVFLVNGWLYRGVPASRIDAIEKKLFDRDYVQLIDVMLVQNDEIKAELIAHGADPERVVTTGNIKFDGIDRTSWSPEQAKDPAMLRAIQAASRPCIVAGCVTNLPDQEAILDAFRATLAAVPDALLVVAPRHPEVLERMQRLEAFLRERALAYAFKSRIGGDGLAPDTQVLVLDTMGELRDFYAVAALTYIGPNHNVLEPLAFDKPVFVLPGWEPGYPSFPVYRMMLARGAIIEVADPAQLAAAWMEFFHEPDRLQSQMARIRSALAREAGATERALAALSAHREMSGEAERVR